MPEIKHYPNGRVKAESVYLQEFRRDVTSQCGEDGLIEKICEILGVQNKWCVEFGAWDGKLYSNSWALINNHGWNAVLIEGNGEKFGKLTDCYSGNEKIVTINALVDFNKGVNSLDGILAGTPIPGDFEFLCIDVDGCDWHIWNSLVNYRPRLIEIEFNPSIPNHVYFVQEPDMAVNHGASLRAMVELGTRKGYELVATTPWNAFFVPREEFGKFNIEDNSLDAMHSPGEFESTLFQLYDGTLVLTGCTKLLWHKVPISFEDIQVLPRALRRYRG
jgi:hypothetical protein